WEVAGAGVRVVYGLVWLKTHCKLWLVVGDGGESGVGIRGYSHLGAGNYHPKTGRLYEDLGLLTADPVVARDVNHLFNSLSGYSVNSDYDRLLVAPNSMRQGLIERIESEIEHEQQGRGGRIRLKVNSLVDEAIIEA